MFGKPGGLERCVWKGRAGDDKERSALNEPVGRGTQRAARDILLFSFLSHH
jgi:hypothetical protein